MAKVDVVVVSFNSAEHLRGAVEPLCALDWVQVIVVDNASSDDSLGTVADLEVLPIPLSDNGGFGHGCNVGWRSGSSLYVMFLNPDARVEPGALAHLVDVLEREPEVGIAAPRITNDDGSLQLTQHHFPHAASTYSRALLLHRVFAGVSWASEDVTEPSAYALPGSPDWVGGACLLIRRPLLENLGGFDESFFHYCEDIDLCRRARSLGFDVRFCPEATAVHSGGASAPPAELLPVLATGRIRYARKHHRRAYAELERGGIILGALSRTLLEGRPRVRAGHARSLLAAIKARADVSPRFAQDNDS